MEPTTRDKIIDAAAIIVGWSSLLKGTTNSDMIDYGLDKIKAQVFLMAELVNGMDEPSQHESLSPTETMLCYSRPVVTSDSSIAGPQPRGHTY